PVRPALLQQPLAEVAQHAVVEARIVEIEAERVLEADPAPHRLGGITVRQAEQELQHAHRGQLRGRDPDARPGGTIRRSPRRPTGRRAGPAPTSPSSRPGYRPAPPARSAPGPRPPGGD